MYFKILTIKTKQIYKKMSTNNQPKQTLFRFVSLRAPQQTDEQGQDKRFVLAPSSLETDNVFYVPVTSGAGTKQELLLESAGAFSNEAYQDVNQIKEDSSPELYDFAIWVARNKGNYSNTELEEKASLDLYSTNIDLDLLLLKLWNNLIYQVVSQKNFYVKETVMQMLLAIHIVQNFGDEEANKILVNARIVLPKALMIDDEQVGPNFHMASRRGNNNGSYSFDEVKKQQEIALANMQLQGLENIEKEIAKIQKLYRKEYGAEYKRQEANYRDEIQPTIDQYQQDVNNAKNAYCDLRDPNAPFNPEDPCQQPNAVPLPNLPPFEFDFRDELDFTSLSEGLSESNFEILLESLGYAVPKDFSLSNLDENEMEAITKALEGISTFQDLETIISRSRNEAQKKISENLDSSGNTYKSIGGVMIPLSRGTNSGYTYKICPKNFGRWTSFDLQLTMPDASWDVAGLVCTLTETTSNVTFQTNNYFVKVKNGNVINLNNLMASATTHGHTLLDLPHQLEVAITFSNGQTTIITGFFDDLKLCDLGSFEVASDDDPNPEIIFDNENFIPSGFGFKQIGIADYLKVEQTTHAYVPGDVAHIENVMAREYRQKSTRRLRRSENTTTTSKDTEREKLTDTTTATRFEMQSEIAKMQAEARDASAYANMTAKWEPITVSAGATYAHHQSKEESTRQAMTEAQDVTERAMDRIVTKVHEERIEKIIEEFEENNAHGLDNREGDKHVVGVFRWVDKLMKNQIYNYGKRMMFEFMVPEPAKLHELGMSVEEKPSEIIFQKPEDPRKASYLQMKDYTSLDNETILKHWVSKFNVEISDKPIEEFSIGKSLGGQYSNDKVHIENAAFNSEIEIPEGYLAYRGTAGYTAATDGDSASVSALLGDLGFFFPGRWGQVQQGGKFTFSKQYSSKIPISVTLYNEFSGTVNFSVELKISQEAKNAWYQKTFKAIIDAYELALTEYEEKVSAEQNKALIISGSNPAFYRQIENTVLRKNCISYMADRTLNSVRGYGLSGLTQGSSFTDYETVLSPTLDKYTAFVKFMEQAFEWENLSYYLYPYYWGSKNNWTSLYQQEDVDPLFRSFLQSGMARVIVTVRPGFEDAVQFFMATGKIWNGGQVPVIGDELYLSIVDEMKEPKGVKQGKAWINRLPTPLTILQAQNIGLDVTDALPFSEEDPKEFEIPEEVIVESEFEVKPDAFMEGVPPAAKVIGGDWN